MGLGGYIHVNVPLGCPFSLRAEDPRCAFDLLIRSMLEGIWHVTMHTSKRKDSELLTFGTVHQTLTKGLLHAKYFPTYFQEEGLRMVRRCVCLISVT